ncbi:multi-sensor signal transduction histidine kinase [Calothrix sp. NIES-2100]|uniref:GAF domain-containing sensor histidine kinase n=1 Tax=Calothrix sp. NIES-2100 TaxID=1954172 RepID=UPI000B5F29BC|nr:multi-sensor signal transduction histidine kinase [Calothrix sp. NIES-2100]
MLSLKQFGVTYCANILSRYGVGIGMSILLLLGIYYLLQRQILQRQRAEILLRHQSDRERLVTQIAQQIRQSLALDQVLATTVAEVQRFLQVDRVLIYRLWNNGTGSAIHETVLPPYPQVLGQIFPEEVFPKEYHQAYSLGKTRTITNVEQADIQPCLVDFVKQFGVQAKLVVPIIHENRQESLDSVSYLWGLLIAHQCSYPRQWEAWEVELMQQLATQVAIAIQQSQLYTQLQQLNTELELRVQQRTAELRAEIAEHQRTEVTLGKNVIELVHPDDLMITRDRLTNTIPSPELTRPIEFRYRHQNGSWRILEAISQPFVDSVATLQIIVNARDITQWKRLDEIRLALEREKELSALKTRFFSMASHEFRTPLSTALAAAQVLETCRDEWDISEKRLRNLRRIQDSVKHMVQLLDDILTINRAETGKLAFNPQPLDLELYCRDFLDEMRESVGSQHNLSFTCQGKSVLVCLDEKLLRSMLSNLLSNAIKYSPQGGIVNLSLEFQSNQMILAVQDRGIGMSQEDQKQLFEPFHRGKNVRTIPGTGLGLVVVKKCVDLHQGTIRVISEVGIGTTCLVTVPLSN